MGTCKDKNTIISYEHMQKYEMKVFISLKNNSILIAFVKIFVNIDLKILRDRNNRQIW